MPKLWQMYTVAELEAKLQIVNEELKKYSYDLEELTAVIQKTHAFSEELSASLDFAKLMAKQISEQAYDHLQRPFRQKATASTALG